ncbi:MAG: serine hydrolase domain-containing protein, partial [Pseudomonadota bacterium]
MTRDLDPDRLTRRLDPWANRYLDAAKLAGLSVLVRQRGTEVCFKAWGVRDLDSGAPFDRDTVARIFSMTKPVTSLVLMMLVEEGALHLDAPLDRFLPAFADARALTQDATHIDRCVSNWCSVGTAQGTDWS